MAHSISQYDGVATVRLDGRINAQDLHQSLKSYLDLRAGGPVILIIDLGFAQALGQQTKAVLYRALQHHYVSKIGFYGANPTVSAELADMIPLLSRIRPLAFEPTEVDVRQKLGLIKPQTERKLSGMLAYLKKRELPTGT